MRLWLWEGNPSHSPTSLRNRSGTAHTALLGGPGAVEGWIQPGPEGGLAEIRVSHRPVLGAEEFGKVSPSPNSRTIQRDQVWDHEFPLRDRKPGAPNPPSGVHPPPSASSRKWGQLWNAASPRDLRRAEVGGAPRSPPSPGPPLTSTAPLHAQPRAAPSAPPARRPAPACRARPLGAAGSDPAPPPRRPRPGPARPPPGPSGRCSAGEGPRSDPAPGARTRAGTRRHACPAGRTLELRSGTQIPSLRGAMTVCLGLGRLRTRRRRITLYPYLGPGASGSWSLFEHKGPGAAAAALPPPLLQSMPHPQAHSPASESREGG